MCLASSGIVLIVVLGFVFGLLPDGPDRFAPLMTVIATLGLALLVGIIINWLGDTDIRLFIISELEMGDHINWTTLTAFVIGGLVLSVSISTAMVVIVSALGADFLVPKIEYTNLIFKGEFIFLSILALAVVVPISEEIFFRSFLSRNFVRLGTGMNIALSALIFAFFHAGQLEIIVISSTFFTGMILGYVYHKAKSVTPCILIHGAQNLLVICFTILMN